MVNYMKIWVIGRSYPLMINNMQGSFEHEQAKMLSEHGNDVSYLACVFHPFKKVKRWGFCNWEEGCLKHFTYSQIYVHERMKLHFDIFKAYVWKNFLCRVEEKTGIPDIIHVHYPANITIARVILEYKKKGTKIICTEHWSQVLKNVIDSYERNQLKLYVDKSDAFICVGKTLKQSVIEITSTKKNIYIVPNIVNSAFKKNNNSKSIFRFIAVGTMIPIKQFDKIILAFDAVFKNIKDVRLTIIGNGIEFNYLKKIISEKSLENKVTLTGRLDHEQTAEYVSNSNALICYSKYETFGVPIIEAWACGLPVIVTTETAVIDKWDNNLGIEVSPDDLKSLEDSMMRLYEDRNKFDPEYISQFAKNHYSEEAVYRMLIDIYEGKGK